MKTDQTPNKIHQQQSKHPHNFINNHIFKIPTTQKINPSTSPHKSIYQHQHHQQITININESSMPCIARLQSFRWKQRLQLLQLLFLPVPKQHQRLCCFELFRRGSAGGHQAVPGARKQLFDGIKRGKSTGNDVFFGCLGCSLHHFTSQTHTHTYIYIIGIAGSLMLSYNQVWMDTVWAPGVWEGLIFGKKLVIRLRVV
jgi:hypothetical protein